MNGTCQVCSLGCKAHCGATQCWPAILDIREALSLSSPCARPAFVGTAFTTLRLLDYPLQEAPEGCEGLITPCCLQSAFSIHQLWVPLHPQLRVSYVFSLISNLEDVQTVILADIDGELTMCRAVFPESLFYVLTHLVLTAVPRGRHCHFQVGDCGWSGVTELEGREDRTSWRTVAPEQVPSLSLARPPIYQ